MHVKKEHIQTAQTLMRRCVVYDQALIHFALIADKSTKGAYQEVVPTSSQILSKLDLERLILVLGICFVHITSRIHQDCDRIFPYFCPNAHCTYA